MNGQYESKQTQTIVIGGGQAGLSVGYYLAKRGLPFLILDGNRRIGDAWRNRWDSLRLFTPARSALPLLDDLGHALRNWKGREVHRTQH